MVAVPPHLLRAISKSKAATPEHREIALASLAHTEKFLKNIQERREQYLKSYNQVQQQIVPPALFRNVIASDQADDAQRSRAQKGLEHLETIIGKVRGAQQALGSSQSTEPGTSYVVQSLTATDDPPYRAVHDIHESSNEGKLPGDLIRDNGKKEVDTSKPSSDKAVNEAFDNVGLVLGFYKKFFQWLSIDNKDMDVISTVHFGKQYENAFWDPEKLQMVFGDGGEFLNNFTGCIDVIGHELTHAVTEHTSPLDYYGQAGALNEHVSDAFGIMVKQRVQDEKSDVADWLIGEDCILPGVKGTALRSMKEPGTAYDDPVFGKDPQEKAGKIWWAALRSGKIPPKSTFKQFATATVDCAQELYGSADAKKVKKAWLDVGVLESGVGTDSSGGWCSIL
ncbi:extracellular metallo ase [Fusarium coicis]|nr:extracellular metallo ase [Fusarium coicis]